MFTVYWIGTWTIDKQQNKNGDRTDNRDYVKTYKKRNKKSDCLKSTEKKQVKHEKITANSGIIYRVLNSGARATIVAESHWRTNIIK